jgi:hypothetical protein
MASHSLLSDKRLLVEKKMLFSRNIRLLVLIYIYNQRYTYFFSSSPLRLSRFFSLFFSIRIETKNPSAKLAYRNTKESPFFFFLFSLSRFFFFLKNIINKK